MKFYSLLLMVVLLAVVCGCSKEKRPAGLPPLHPLTIEIYQDGAPLEQAGVDLLADDPAIARWPAGGTTDEKGQCRIYTYGLPGAPEGKFKVTVSKTVTEGEAASVSDPLGKSTQKVFQLVESVYTSEKTPLTLDFQAGQKEPVRLEVGKKVKKIIAAPK